jgi:hypothetical protein
MLFCSSSRTGFTVGDDWDRRCARSAAGQGPRKHMEGYRSRPPRCTTAVWLALAWGVSLRLLRGPDGRRRVSVHLHGVAPESCNSLRLRNGGT